MGILAASCSFTRFKIIDTIPYELWEQIPNRLRQYAFHEIEDSPEIQSYGWVSFEDMLDSEWRSAPPEKGEYLTFGLRLDIRRIPTAVLKKYTLLAFREEKQRIFTEQGKKFLGREKKQELRESVRLRLLRQVLPVPAVFDVVWATEAKIVYFTSIQNKLVELFTEFFTTSFDLHLEPLTPLVLAETFIEKPAVLDSLEPSCFV